MAGGMVPLTSFSPDSDPLTPGVITDGNDFVPTLVGFRTLPDLLRYTQPLPNRCRGAAAITFADGVQWIVAGCCDDSGANVSLNTVKATDLNVTTPPQWNTEALVDRTFVGRWRFDVWQNPNAVQIEQEIIAVDGVTAPLFTTRGILESGVANPWKLLPGDPPIASHVAASDFYLFLVGERQADLTLNAVLPIQSNRWWASSDSHKWNLAITASTISVSARLGQTSGPITALLALRSTMIAYKTNATYIGNLQQPPLVWIFNEASRQTGAQGQEGVLAIRDTHNFVGPDDFFTLDGFAINPIPNSLRRWFTQRVSRVGRQSVYARFDQDRSLAFMHYATIDAPDHTVPNEWIVLNFVTGQWAVGQLNIQVTLRQPIQCGNDTCSGLINEDGTLCAYGHDGLRTQPGAYLITGDLGDRRMMYETQPIRPAFTVLNGAPTLTPLTTYVSGKAYTAGPTSVLTQDGWFQMQSMARLQRMKLTADADVEIANLDVPMAPMGDT